MRALPLATLALLTSLLLSGCDSPATPPPAWQLGILVDTSGPSASLGISGRNGMQLAVEQANAQGGMQGRPVELVFRDDAFNPVQARHAAGELIALQVDAALGPMTSLVAEQVAPLFSDAGILLMGGSPLTRQLAGRDDQFFRTLSHDNPDARAIARHLREALQLQHLAVLVESSNSAFTRPWLDDFTAHFEALGGQLHAPIEFQRDHQTDFAALARQALASGPQGVVLVSSALDTALLATQLRQQHPGLPLAAPAWSAADDLIGMGGKAVEGLVTSQVFDLDDPSAHFRAFRDAFEKRFGQPINTASVTGYNAAQVLLEAMRQGQPGESLKQTLLRIRRFNGLQYEIVFDDYGDSHSPFYLMVVRDGRYSRAD